MGILEFYSTSPGISYAQLVNYVLPNMSARPRKVLVVNQLPFQMYICLVSIDIVHRPNFRRSVLSIR